MSGDLEDFLRRAAQRRKAKAAQQQQQEQPQPQPRRQPRPYSDRRTERVVHPRDTDEVLTAEVVEDDSNSLAARLRRVEETKQAAARAKAEVAKKLRQGKAARSKGSGVAIPLTGNRTQDLIRMLQHSGGIRQAILLREILDRPEHRW